jgi:hypothetical protein
MEKADCIIEKLDEKHSLFGYIMGDCVCVTQEIKCKNEVRILSDRIYSQVHHNLSSFIVGWSK